MSLRKDSVCSSMSTSRAPSATSYVSSTAMSHNLENGDGSLPHDIVKVGYWQSLKNFVRSTIRIKRKSWSLLKKMCVFFFFFLQQTTRKIPEPIAVARTSAEPLIPVLVHTTLIRDQNGLGFSIAGGKGSSPFKDNTDVSFSLRKSVGKRNYMLRYKFDDNQTDFDQFLIVEKLGLRSKNYKMEEKNFTEKETIGILKRFCKRGEVCLRKIIENKLFHTGDIHLENHRRRRSTEGWKIVGW